jgi:AmiR/NasT family two-component response regulator
MYRVVIADDEVLIRMYIREILENNGYEVVGEAEDGLDAIAVCRQKKPDFVIMDINMPVMTGLEATKVINEDKLAGFVIILTAYRDKEIADQAVNTDVMGYIVKLVDEDTLIPAVKIAIHNYKQREAMAKEFHKTQEALDDRKYLDRAKGLVMERKNMSEKEAFTYIRSLSMDKGISMTELSKMLLKAYEG